MYGLTRGRLAAGMKYAGLLLTPDADLDVELALDVGEVCFWIRKVVGIKSEGTPGTRSEKCTEIGNKGFTTRIASSKSSLNGKRGLDSCDLAFPARNLRQSRQNMKSGMTWTTKDQTSRMGAT